MDEFVVFKNAPQYISSVTLRTKCDQARLIRRTGAPAATGELRVRIQSYDPGAPAAAGGGGRGRACHVDAPRYILRGPSSVAWLWRGASESRRRAWPHRRGRGRVPRPRRHAVRGGRPRSAVRSHGAVSSVGLRGLRAALKIPRPRPAGCRRRTAAAQATPSSACSWARPAEGRSRSRAAGCAALPAGVFHTDGRGRGALTARPLAQARRARRRKRRCVIVATPSRLAPSSH